MMRNRKNHLAVVGLVTVLGVTSVGCSDDEETDTAGGADAGATTTSTTTALADDTTSPDTDPEATDGEGTTVEVTASDYEFYGVPAVVSAGSTISLTTAVDSEPHEFVAFVVPESETRTVDELMELTDDELEGLFPGEPAVVTIALPGTTDTPGVVVGDSTLTEPGRYIYICTFPEGTTEEDVANAVGPLEGENPHYRSGMIGELTVE